jgi:hypothetical protein
MIMGLQLSQEGKNIENRVLRRIFGPKREEGKGGRLEKTA